MDITTVQEFDTIIKENEVVLVDFWAPWCGPCRMLTPIIKKLTGIYPNNIVKVNVDLQKELASRYGIRGIPSVKIFKNGEIQETLQGVRAANLYEDKMKYYMGN